MSGKSLGIPPEGVPARDERRGIPRGDSGRKKNRAVPGSFWVGRLSAQNRDADAASDLRQFGKRKFLNFNSSFNDCHIHDYPLLPKKDSQKTNRGCR